MSRSALIRLLLVLGLLGGCVALAMNVEPRLGIDLRGGSQLMYDTEGTEGTEVTADNVDKTIEVLRGRVDAIGVSEPTLTRVGEDRILVELPDVQDPEQAKEVIGKAAQLFMRPVVGAVQGPNAEKQNPKNVILESDQGDGFLELGPVAVRGENINSANAGQSENIPGWVVDIDFDGTGSKQYEDVTGKAACNPMSDPKRRVAIVLDGEVISSPEVNQGVACNGGIRGGTQITGNFSESEARDLALLIEAGALPLTLGSEGEDGAFKAGVPLQDSVIGPTLGDAAIDASIEAAIIGLALTGLFIIIVYRLVGFLATLALTSYAVLAYAMTIAVGATLTLPGLAGFVLAIGLAIDANVLVFERAREEYAENPKAGLRRALMIGFNKAWTAIMDSNVTTLLAALLLFIFASGSVKGFGVTLSIGVVASMVSALIIARVLTEIAVSSRPVARRPVITGLANVGRVRTWLMKTNPQIIDKKRLWMILSGLLLVVALVGIFGKGLNLGLEFTGGRTIVYETSQTVSADDGREVVEEVGIDEAVVQSVTGSDGEDRLSIRAGEITNEQRDEIRAGLAEIGGETTQYSDETVEPTLGEELLQKAIFAFVIALAVQMLYLAFRFHWTFALSAVVGMANDVLLVTGIFAWLGRPIDGIYLAAALTIIGLSVNDTVVVFDRIRERWRGTTTGSFEDISNYAILETMPRTINTGLGAMFILGALAVLAGESLENFSLALLLGLIIGTVSTVLVATPLAAYLQKVQAYPRVGKEKKARDPNDSGAVV